MKEAFSVKLQDEKFSFHLRWKLNESPNNTIFEHIHQIIKACARGKKKSVLINDYENIIAYCEESQQSQL